jgi:uncharacterized protein
MKSGSLFLFSIVISILLFSSALLPASPVQVRDTINIMGIWVGELEIPNQAKLRMGLIISATPENTYKAALNIIDQATGDIPCDNVIYRNDSVVIRLPALGIEIAGTVDLTSNYIKSEFRQYGAIFPVLFTRTDRLPELLRPQEPKEPFPYTREEVVFENKSAGIKLAGTLTIPEKKGFYPAVILVTGSGQQDRNEEVAKHKPFWVIADYLSRNGIAVLRCDDRGTGGSTGNFDQSTTGDFASDALAGITYLQSRTEIRPDQIGIIGHSEGGTAASLAASQSNDVSFILGMAGFVKNFENVALEQLLDQSRQEGKNADDIELERNWRKSIYSIAKEKTDSATAAKKLWALFDGLSVDEINRLNWPRGRHESQIRQILSPWWRYSLSLDNGATLMNVKCPVLALYGELDKQVNADENIPFVETSLKKGGNIHYEIKELPGLNHLFQNATTGSEYEYFRIEETISPQVLQIMADWIKSITGAK